MPKNNIGPVNEGHSQEEPMSKRELEQYFTAIKDDFNHVDERFDRLESRMDQRFSQMDQRFNRLESVCFAILELTRGYDARFKNQDSRIFKLEKKLV